MSIRKIWTSDYEDWDGTSITVERGFLDGGAEEPHLITLKVATTPKDSTFGQAITVTLSLEEWKALVSV